MTRTIKLVRSLETHYGYLKAGSIIVPSNEAIAQRLIANNVAVEEVEPEPERIDTTGPNVTYMYVDTALEEEPTDDDSERATGIDSGDEG